MKPKMLKTAMMVVSISPDIGGHASHVIDRVAGYHMPSLPAVISLTPNTIDKPTYHQRAQPQHLQNAENHKPVIFWGQMVVRVQYL